jgi:hypothetical protein
MARDKYHELVKQALIEDGWTITDDPLRLSKLDRPVEIDLGAERLIRAKRGMEMIAVEVKSFLGLSEVYDFYQAIGQFTYYKEALEEVEPDRMLYLAVPFPVYEGLFQEFISQKVIKNYNIRLIVYDLEAINIVSWRS